MKDNEFVNYIMAILGMLVAVAAIILVLANSLADSQQTMDMAMLERTKDRRVGVTASRRYRSMENTHGKRHRQCIPDGNKRDRQYAT